MSARKEKIKARLVSMFRPSKEPRPEVLTVPVFREKNEIIGGTTTAQEVKRRRIYANVPLGME